jgi:hypothetical protein
MNEEEKTIRLRWLDTDSKLACETLLCDALNPTFMQRWKRRALERLGIQMRDGESASDAWLRTMCEENGLEFKKPVDRQLADAILENASCHRFYFALL